MSTQRRRAPSRSEPPQEAQGPKGLPEGSLISEPLRREAERAWAESAKSAKKGAKRTAARVQRRKASRDKDADIARLADKLARAEGELVRQRRRRDRPKGA